MGGQYTAEELSGLSQEEQDALNGVDEDSADDATLEEIAGEDDDSGDDSGDEGEGDDDNAGADDADEGADNQAAGDDQGAAEAGAGGEADEQSSDDPFSGLDVPEITFVPKFTGEILPEFQAEIDALTAKFDEGDLSVSELMAQTRKIEANSNNTFASQQLWAKEQEVFLSNNPQFDATKNRILFGALNQEVIRLANSPEGAGKTGIQILYAAKSSVEKALGVTTQNGKQSAVIPQKPKAGKPAHQTLATIPAAEAEDTSGDRFAFLDRLNGVALESALAKLSSADYEAYQHGKG